MNRTDTMTPAEHAELVRDARTIITAVERALQRTTAVFVAASVLTIAAMVLNLLPVASVTSAIALGAFGLALLLLVTRVALGPVPDEVATTTPVQAPADPATGSGSPATGSSAATPGNGVITPK